MARPRKMITEKDISKNSSIKISGTINRIKANERKYTLCLSIIFMFLFVVIGYFTLRINVGDNNAYLRNNSLTINSKLVTLSEDDILSEQDGLNTEDYVLTLYNGMDKDVKYRVLLVKDETLTNLCDCRDEEFDVKSLRLSFIGDIVTYSSLENILIDTGELKEKETKKIKVKVWLNEEANTHFHGRFVLERIS